MAMLSGNVVGRSFREWTTNDIDPFSRAASNSWVNTPFPPISGKDWAKFLSPVVSIVTVMTRKLLYYDNQQQSRNMFERKCYISKLDIFNQLHSENCELTHTKFHVRIMCLKLFDNMLCLRFG